MEAETYDNDMATMAAPHCNSHPRNPASSKHGRSNLMPTTEITIRGVTYLKRNSQWFRYIDHAKPPPDFEPLDERYQDILNQLADMNDAQQV